MDQVVFFSAARILRALFFKHYTLGIFFNLTLPMYGRGTGFGPGEPDVLPLRSIFNFTTRQMIEGEGFFLQNQVAVAQSKHLFDFDRWCSSSWLADLFLMPSVQQDLQAQHYTRTQRQHGDGRLGVQSLRKP